MKTSPMAKIYKNRIEAGIMTLEDVPERWRETTRELIERENNIEPDSRDI